MRYRGEERTNRNSYNKNLNNKSREQFPLPHVTDCSLPAIPRGREDEQEQLQQKPKQQVKRAVPSSSCDRLQSTCNNKSREQFPLPHVRDLSLPAILRGREDKQYQLQQEPKQQVKRAAPSSSYDRLQSTGDTEGKRG